MILHENEREHRSQLLIRVGWQRVRAEGSRRVTDSAPVFLSSLEAVPDRDVSFNAGRQKLNFWRRRQHLTGYCPE